MADDSTQPATKGDLQQFRTELKADVQELRGDIDRKMKQIKEEILLHFDVVAENMTSNFQGAFSDKLEGHEQRITRLEQHTGAAV